MNDLYALIERVRNGDLEALYAAVELAERMVLMQELASAPAGIRAEALAGVTAKWKARRAQKNRSKATAASNKARGERHQANIDKTLATMALHDKPERDLTGIVRNSLKAYKRKLKKKTGLRKVPCQTAVRRRIKKNASTGVAH